MGAVAGTVNELGEYIGSAGQHKGRRSREANGTEIHRHIRHRARTGRGRGREGERASAVAAGRTGRSNNRHKKVLAGIKRLNLRLAQRLVMHVDFVNEAVQADLAVTLTRPPPPIQNWLPVPEELFH